MLAADPPPDGPLAALRLQVPLRTYQAQILDAVAADVDRRHHLVAPPGSGKTLLGLELVRRYGRAAVVFAPTTTIAAQWRDELELFTDKPAAVRELVSLDPQHPAPLTVLTYQAISVPARAGALLADLARRAWVEELVQANRVPDEAAAERRLATMAVTNPRRHRDELRRRGQALKRVLLRGEVPASGDGLPPSGDEAPAGDQAPAAHDEVAAIGEKGPPDAGWLEHLLHPNARKLVARLVDRGVGTVVLDECHHLLDYWAIVLRHLLDRLDAAGYRPRTIGLTATLPSPDNAAEAENYAALLGEVDYEVPTPAVVKEGELAPYDDLVAFVTPTRRERAWLAGVHEAFEAAVGELTTTEAFVGWVVEQAVAPALATQTGHDPDAWAAWLRQRPLGAIAALRCLERLGTPVPEGVPVPVEAHEPMGLADWCALFERWALDRLALSADRADHERLARLRDGLAPFGISITERGLRQDRSAGDLLLAMSEAKASTAADLVAAEHAALSDRLRAVVVTDFDRMASAPARLRGVLEPDAGSARRLFRTLAEHPKAKRTDPVLVTGRVVGVGNVTGQDLVDWLNVELAAHGVDAWCRLEATAHTSVYEIAGQGAWSPRTYVPLLTAAFAEGRTRCLVGTRGLLGEGWDARRCNTLVDLTGVTTPTATQQLRGRTLRLDPDWPRKVAHNWDVITVAPGYERGDSDLERFRRRHRHLWGPVVRADDRRPAEIIRGVGHVDTDLALQLSTRPFADVDFAAATRPSRARIGDRAAIYDAWGVGQPYA
ncbi:MAG: DEAD/DEAH box helicase family protein, partial [Egibacteraceae bacterium]